MGQPEGDGGRDEVPHRKSPRPAAAEDPRETFLENVENALERKNGLILP